MLHKYVKNLLNYEQVTLIDNTLNHDKREKLRDQFGIMSTKKTSSCMTNSATGESRQPVFMFDRKIIQSVISHIGRITVLSFSRGIPPDHLPRASMQHAGYMPF